MIDYRTPLGEILFTLEHVAEARRLPDWDGEVAAEVLGHAARFMDEMVAPLDPIGDREGVRLEDGRVKLPAAFHAAYHAYCDGGWPGISAPAEYGGAGLPDLIGGAFAEMLSGACISFHMSVSLAQGVMRTLLANATAAMKARWVPRLASGEWLATMCLTEPQAGSDLGLIRTTATPDGDAWRLSGGKIFISGGDQDLTGRALHLVLARTADAPEGLKGLSLFLAPSQLEDGTRNNISILRVEEKMGLHASPTCQLAFDGTRAEMIGAPGEGLKRMFTLMNLQRLDVSLQGAGLAACASQRTLAYINTRRQGKGATGTTGTALIAEHDDVRRMALTQIALAMGSRAMSYRLLVDMGTRGSTPLVDMMTAVCKYFCTEAAVEAAQLAIQSHGGYGYLNEYRVEQILRDGRVSQIYEGANGIHAMTLAGRLIKMDGVVAGFAADVTSAIDVARAAGCEATARALTASLASWREATAAVVAAPRPGAIADAYMRLTGLLSFGAVWARIEQAAAQAPNPERIKATARFVREFMLPATAAHAAICITAPGLDQLPAAVLEA